jgi:hypothetical protein
MGIFQITLILATFLCSLVAGFLFAFAIVAMPGIRSLNDREFIRVNYSHIQTLMSPVVNRSEPNQSRGTCIKALCSSQSFLSLINMFRCTSFRPTD